MSVKRQKRAPLNILIVLLELTGVPLFFAGLLHDTIVVASAGWALCGIAIILMSVKEK